MIFCRSKFSHEETQKFLITNPPSALPKSFPVMKRKEQKLVEMTLNDIEKFFGFIYRPLITFTSEESFFWTLNHCPHVLRHPWVAKENHELFSRFKKEIQEGYFAPMSIRWINESKMYGLIAEAKIPSGAFVGEYAGVVRRLSRIRKDTNPYCFYYPTSWWGLHPCAIDPQKYGNIMRFANHDDNPTLELQCAVDRGLLHTVLIAKRDIDIGEELTFDYGPDYWLHREKNHSSSLKR